LVLIGATTENPSFEVNAALLSRSRVVVLRALDEKTLDRVLQRALTDADRGLGARRVRVAEDAAAAMVGAADGDARRLLNVLETAAGLAPEEESGDVRIDLDQVREAVQTATLRYDRAGEEHFNLISAFQKSIRASDPQGTVYWLRRMLRAGEDPLYVARRLVRIASEDVGLADPGGLVQAVAAQQAVHFVGLPEGGLALVQCAVYLALAPKSNRLEVAEMEADAAIEETGSLPVPEAFRNAPTALMKDLGYGSGYAYDHDAPGGFAGQKTLPPSLQGRRFYAPTDRGWEGEQGAASSPATEDADSPGDGDLGG
jgi:putative ATPase